MKRNQNKMLARAIHIAAEAHIKQLDKGGKAYILHPLRVMERLKTNDLELMQIAVMHDVVEDSDITIDDLEKKGFSRRVIDAVKLLTRDDSMDYKEYVERLSSNQDCVLVKIKDLEDNLDLSRLWSRGEFSRKDLDRHERYHKAHKFLKDKIL